MIPILFQDKSLAVCLKPPGLLSQDGPGGTLPAQLREQLGCEIYPVHRLDREAGGVMVYAKTSRAAGALSAAMNRGEFQKQYLCIVRGCPEEEGVWRDLLFHDRTRNKSFVVQRMRGGVKEAGLDYRLLGTKDGQSLVLVRLHTGRTHQIRVQFASRGMPLAGDGKYGGGGGGELGLWSCLLAFPHPAGKRMAFQALPEGQSWEAFDEELAAFQTAKASELPLNFISERR